MHFQLCRSVDAFDSGYVYFVPDLVLVDSVERHVVHNIAWSVIAFIL